MSVLNVAYVLGFFVDRYNLPIFDATCSLKAGIILDLVVSTESAISGVYSSMIVFAKGSQLYCPLSSSLSLRNTRGQST